VSTATTRVLRLLALLQSRRDWTGPELGERLEVDVRTVRRDVERLRRLGYVIESSAGIGGGYRMGAGASMPPLLLDDDEVSAVVVALSAAAGSIAGLRETALGVLLKLDQILPKRLRSRLDAFESATLALPARGGTVDWKLLTTLTAACREHEELEFEYLDKGGRASSRRVEPLHVVHAERFWYLVAWDVGRAAFRTFRLDRIKGRRLRRGARFSPRALPEDLVSYVSRSLTQAPHRHQMRIELVGTPSELAPRIPSWLGVLESVGPRRSSLTVGGDDYESLAARLLLLGVPFERVEPPEAARALREVAGRLFDALEPCLPSESEAKSTLRGTRAAERADTGRARGRGSTSRRTGASRRGGTS